MCGPDPPPGDAAETQTEEKEEEEEPDRHHLQKGETSPVCVCCVSDCPPVVDLR